MPYGKNEAWQKQDMHACWKEGYPHYFSASSDPWNQTRTGTWPHSIALPLWPHEDKSFLPAYQNCRYAITFFKASHPLQEYGELHLNTGTYKSFVCIYTCSKIRKCKCLECIRWSERERENNLYYTSYKTMNHQRWHLAVPSRVGKDITARMEHQMVREHIQLE